MEDIHFEKQNVLGYRMVKFLHNSLFKLQTEIAISLVHDVIKITHDFIQITQVHDVIQITQVV